MTDNAHDEFRAALKKLPTPISCVTDGAVCPWCGELHQTVTFGANHCLACQRPFSFGYPAGGWHDGKDPISWVDFPFREFEAMGGKASAMADWEPNCRLKALYFQKSEEYLGTFADTSKAN